MRVMLVAVRLDTVARFMAVAVVRLDMVLMVSC